MELENDCENEEYTFIEEVLRKHFNDPHLVVDRVACELGSSVGDNFLSVIKRATVTGKKFSGSEDKGAIIVYLVCHSINPSCH